MKRRGFIKAVGAGGAATMVPKSLFGLEEPEHIPEMVVGVNHLDQYECSSDHNDFVITIDMILKRIDLYPRFPEKPHLTVLALHRHVCDLLDRAWCAEAELLDITHEPITERPCDSIIHMVNGWTVTPRGKETLVGGIVEGDSAYCTIQMIGEMDYTLTAGIKLTSSDGTDYPYNKTGYTRVPVKPNDFITFSCESYRNSHYTDKGVEYGVWVDRDWTVQSFTGVILIPIFSTGIQQS